jgi:hypothetical protein
MSRIIGSITAPFVVVFVVVIFFNTLPLSLFVLVGLGLWGWRMLATRVSGAADAMPAPPPLSAPPPPSAPDPLVIQCGNRSFYEGLGASEPLVSSATTAEQSKLTIAPSCPGRQELLNSISTHGATTNPSAPAVRAPISRALRNQIYARDRYTCQKCGAKKGDLGVQLVIDHKKPVKRGGTNHPSNLQTLCSLCNSKKGAKNTGFGDWESPTADDWS